ncbi:tudor domain-containing protein 5 isoform X2 [Silurus meridionalis]|uniref:tudor domain-containing protein 5 isoform X2 n=1 Tax=Silurus meridionalis TaxID=175797 RepID=UPI001EEB3B4A|nr:tudor domain-containing protein 5 isoform X2 [Silurus meridionalis]
MDPEHLLSNVKRDIRALLISSKHGLSSEQLRKDYQNMLGHPIPLKLLGFRSMLDMLREMPDTVRLDYALDGTVVLKAIGNETTKGIEDLISKQKTCKPKHKFKSGGSGLLPSPSLHHQGSFVLPRRAHAPPALSAQLRSQLRQLLIHGPIGLSQLERCYSIRFGRPLCVAHYGFYSIAEMLAAASDMITVKQTRMGSQLILKTEHTPVRQMHNRSPALPKQATGTSSHPVMKKITSEVPGQMAVLSNNQPKAQQKANNTAAIRVQEIEHIHLKKSYEKSVAKLEEEFRKRLVESGDAGTVSQELKEKLRKVVAEHGQGMAIHSLPGEYKKMYSEDLPLAQCGFLSVTEMVEALSDTFSVQPSTEEGAKHLLIMELKPNDQPAFSQNPSTEGQYLSCNDGDWACQDDGGASMDSLESDPEMEIATKTIHQKPVDIFAVTVPLDALQCQKLKPPNRWRERELVPVVVEKIESPSLFYVRLEDQDSRTLEHMMFEMRSCYSCQEVAERYRLPDAYVRPGQACCVAPGDTWFYRVVIHRLLNTSEVEVYYVDFGDLTAVSRSRLQFLKSCYAELPVQAVPCVLAGAKPVKRVWSKEATSSFQKLCYDRTLVAAIHSYQHDFLLTFLCDTQTEEDLYIHSVLEAEGHAVACSAVSTPFNPVALYLGEGQLEEVNDGVAAVASSPNVTSLTQHLQPDASTIRSQVLTENSTHSQEMTLLDLPALEFIDVAQGKNSKPLDPLLNKEPASFGNWEQGWRKKANIDDQKPEFLQNGREESATTEVLSIKPEKDTQPVLESEKTQKPAANQHVVRDQTPGPISSCIGHTGPQMSAELFQPLSTNLMFSMFSSGDKPNQEALFLRHVSPLALGPSARMAAGSNLLQWYTHKQV